MNQCNPINEDKWKILSNTLKKHNVFLGKSMSLFIKVLTLFYLISLSTLSNAESVITNTATANYSINGNVLSITDSVQFTKDTVVVPAEVTPLIKLL